MLYYNGSRFEGKILHDVKGIIYICKVGLAGMLSRLNHILFCNGGYQAITRYNKFTPPKHKVPLMSSYMAPPGRGFHRTLTPFL